MIGLVVHTTGVNWDGILANAAAVIVIVGSFSTLLIRSFKRSTKDVIYDVIDAKITPVLESINESLRDHDTRIARMEGIEEGKKQAVAQAATTRVKP